ncbi:hypothetical protein Nepgr_019698 [Nepenthes gracilis]|uniref:Uncharacterized protein n=1 Tax=Nepenthes gracilis TaxID=150966 RepID=A0AAD3SVI4_NEPGR|nr:hypothetical protein Nepgr_019698 [Nepenthes gracilis]
MYSAMCHINEGMIQLAWKNAYEMGNVDGDKDEDFRDRGLGGSDSEVNDHGYLVSDILFFSKRQSGVAAKS